MKDLWFTHFERELAERGWFDTHDDKAYEEAGEAAYEALLDAPEEDE